MGSVQTFSLTGLKGVSKKETKAIFIKKPSQIIKAVLDKGMAFTSAGDNGAINIWKDDSGNIQCEAMRWLNSIDKQTFTNIKSVKVWADKWLHEIGGILRSE